VKEREVVEVEMKRKLKLKSELSEEERVDDDVVVNRRRKPLVWARTRALWEMNFSIKSNTENVEGSK